VNAGGRGALVVTAFHPYVQLEPRIRYRPGDVVELSREPCPVWGELGFRPLGRENRCLVTDGEIISPADCFCSLADLPQVAVVSEPEVPGALDGHYDEAGSPRFSLRRGNDRIELHVELRFAPRVWAEEAALVQSAVRTSLGDRVSVVVHGPGELTDPSYV
jgi:phenylacetate-coenzyme A ligase PaaK-like adenylate-forming protein